jgi:hypothetical protein
MTGTAVNPLLRAVYLARRKEKHHVTLLVPWIEPSEQHHIFSKGVVYERKEQLEAYIRDWVRINLGFVTKIKIAWWDGVYLIPYGSILPKGDPIESIPPGERDVAVLEEPEHLTWCVSLSTSYPSFAACWLFCLPTCDIRKSRFSSARLTSTSTVLQLSPHLSHPPA